MDSTDSAILSLGVILLLGGVLLKRKRSVRTVRRFWVNPYLRERSKKGRFAKDFEDMVSYEDEFKRNFHMNVNEFEILYNKLKHRLEPKNTRTDVISGKERLSMTLEYLAGGAAFERYIASVYRISRSSVAKIIFETCTVIYEELAKSEFPKYTKDFWISNVTSYFNNWNFPHCLGSIDGKHVKIKKPANAGSAYFNYKNFHSIILMAVADADYRFSFIDVGSPGADGDLNSFSRTSIGQKILQDDATLNVPNASPIEGMDGDIPYFFVADDAFPLDTKIMKPYSGRFSQTGLDTDKIVFNYRLSRARRTVENAFGILVMRWGCLRSEIQSRPEKVQVIVAACCTLHNYLMKESSDYFNTSMVDKYTENGDRIDGEWRTFQQLTPLNNAGRQGRSKLDASLLRDNLKRYVNEINVIPNQQMYAFRQ